VLLSFPQCLLQLPFPVKQGTNLLLKLVYCGCFFLRASRLQKLLNHGLNAYQCL
jgi:hypothetical protein